ncbi:MAG: hypothetical protein ACRCWQ_07620 [Bacilli bacterium]
MISSIDFFKFDGLEMGFSEGLQYGEFKLTPQPSHVFSIDTNDRIVDFYLLLFSKLNQFPLYATFEWSKCEEKEAEEILKRIGIRKYTKKVLEKHIGFELWNGKYTNEILIFNVEIRNSIDLQALLSNYLKSYQRFILCNHNRIKLSAKYGEPNCIEILLDRDSILCIMQDDIPSTFLMTDVFQTKEELEIFLESKER